jgi:cell division protein FtsW
VKAELQHFGLRAMLQRWRATKVSRERALPVRSGLERVTPVPTRIAGFDQTLVLLVVALLAFGLVMVYSASVALPDNPKGARLSELHFLTRHALAIGIGVVAALLALQVPVAVWEKWAPWLFVGALLLLALVLLPFVSHAKNGARRWIPLGFLNFQPSELAKLAMTMYAASYMVRKMDVKENFIKAVWPMAVALGAIGVLLLAEPDMGAFMVIAAIALGVLFLGGVNGRMFLLSVAVLLGAFTLMIVFSEFRRQRIFAYLDPWNPTYAQGKAYQLTHSLIAFGRGEWLGVGLGGSVEKLNYLPEAHTDFILAVIGEELGFVGVICVILLFYWIVRRAFEIGRQALALDRTFAGLMAKGVGIWFGAQTFINMGVNLGLLPTKGLTLPLVSYGGSGILLNCVALAVLLRVDYENRVLMRGGKV